jgi:hypothetical protein
MFLYQNESFQAIPRLYIIKTQKNPKAFCSDFGKRPSLLKKRKFFFEAIQILKTNKFKKMVENEKSSFTSALCYLN